MKLLLFGGTFDPPHLGHIHNLEAAIRAVNPDLVVVIPAGIPPHKAEAHTSGEIRLEMCRCFQECFPNLVVSRWEVDQEGKSYSIHTLEHLAREYPEAEIYMAVGSDMLLTFTQWHRWREILQRATLVCTSRQAGDDPQLIQAARALEEEGGRVILAPASALEVSSTQIRQGKARPELLPPLVQELVEKYHLYQENFS